MLMILLGVGLQIPQNYFTTKFAYQNSRFNLFQVKFVGGGIQGMSNFKILIMQFYFWTKIVNKYFQALQTGPWGPNRKTSKNLS
jgi:hypothetical protein